MTVVGDEGLRLYQAGAYAAAVVEQVNTGQYDAILLAATALGKDLAPRVAARLDLPLATDVTAIDGSDGMVVTRPAYAGKAVYRLRMAATPCVVSVRPNAVAAVEQPRECGVATVAAPEAEVRARVVEVREPDNARLDVSEAPIVVSGGRGLKEAEHFSLVEDLAAAFGNAAVGASRAVVDAGWRPHAEQVGQTGKTVSPQLYIALGISGAVQHLAGMRTAKVIVAINKDPDAPIFKVADYGIVGDLFEVVPRLTEEIRKIRSG